MGCCCQSIGQFYRGIGGLNAGPHRRDLQPLGGQQRLRMTGVEIAIITPPGTIVVSTAYAKGVFGTIL